MVAFGRLLGSPGKFDRHAFRGHEESNTDVSIAVEINAEHYMVHSAAWKMIFDVNRNESTVLFDLRRDAHENVNLLAAHQAQVSLHFSKCCGGGLSGHAIG